MNESLRSKVQLDFPFLFAKVKTLSLVSSVSGRIDQIYEIVHISKM